MTTMLTRDQILAADDLKRQAVAVPEWGGDVYVRMLTGGERDAFEVSAELKDRKNIRAKLLSLTVCDEAGVRLFTDADILALTGKSAAALERLFEAAMKLNRIGAKDVEELEKNSESGPRAASGS